MNEKQEQALIERAKNWLAKRKNASNEERKDAYLEGIEDALMSIFEDTYHGAFPAHNMNDKLEEIFES